MQRAHPAVNPPMAPENPYDIASYPLLVVVSGPSGVGKDTLLQRLKDVGSDFWFVVTMTSRAQRPGEVDGKDYFFVTREEFDATRAMAQKAREENAALEARIAALEAQLAKKKG